MSMTERRLEWHDLKHWAWNTQHRCLFMVFIWKHTQVCPSSPFSLLHRVQNVFALLCSPQIFPLPLFSPPSLANLWRISFLSFLFSLLPPLPLLLVLCPWPHPPSHRYLTPCSKSEFYDVTKWVEDVNRNTQRPFLRYYLSPCPVTHTLVDSSLHFLVWFLVRFRAILGIFLQKVSRSERCKKLACCSVGFSIKGDWPQHQTVKKKSLFTMSEKTVLFF